MSFHKMDLDVGPSSHAEVDATLFVLGQIQVDAAVGGKGVGDDFGTMLIAAGGVATHHDIGFWEVNYTVRKKIGAGSPGIIDTVGQGRILIERKTLPWIIDGSGRRYRQRCALTIAVRKVDGASMSIVASQHDCGAQCADG